MLRKPVNSSNLESIGYDEDTSVLEIAFQGGGIYQYFNVPKGVYLDIMAAESHGKFFHRHIKGQYLYEKIM